MNTKARAIALYVAGASMNAAAKAVGVTGQTVERWLVERGIQVRNRKPRYIEAQRLRAIRLYVDRLLSAQAVASKLSLKTFTVKEWVKAAGVIRTMSEAASLSVVSKSRVRASSRLWYASAKTGERHFAESSLEFLRMQQLDADVTIQSWDRCRERIPYMAPDGRLRHYVPDFTVVDIDGHISIEELKPLALLIDPINVAKFAACRMHCSRRGWKFQILTEVDVGYVRSLAPSSLSKEEQRHRRNDCRRKSWANQTPEERSNRLAKNAVYMREYNAGKRRRT